jgi:hypothetical protein
MAKVPLSVYKDEAEWKVRIGKQGEIIYTADKKDHALTAAERATSRRSALAGNYHRPGVVVLTRNGDYSRFIENESYLKTFERNRP